MTSVYDALLERLSLAFSRVSPGADPVLRPSERADYQANGALALAKLMDASPREVAQRVLEAADLSGMATLEVAGPGFLNVTLEEGYLANTLTEVILDPRLGVVLDAPRRVVVDYSAPNVAKEMHVGHLRSTVIGDALARTHRFVGHEVIARNHVGDWGTPFGMLIEHLLDLGESAAAAELSIGDLDGFYKAARAKFEGSDSFKERSRRRVVLFQGGDSETLRLWRILVDQSVRYFSEVYDKLDVTLRPEDIVGESYYNSMLNDVLTELDEKGILEESDGALCVFPQGFVGRDGERQPLIVRKSDEGFGYGATDLAAIRDRTIHLGADELLYVVGTPQAQHLAMVFEVARMAGWLKENVRCEHVAFGHVLGPDHKMLKSRSGETVKLVSLLDEATERAALNVRARSSELSETEIQDRSRQIARAAIKYADLSSERQRDYVFDLERMVASDGDTGPYLQYAHARLCSILRRAPDVEVRAVRSFDFSPSERHLAMGIVSLPEAILSTLSTSQPHRLCTYLFDLAQRVTAFYDACPVLSSEGEVRAQRLALCDVAARTIALGLSVLGIETPGTM